MGTAIPTGQRRGQGHAQGNQSGKFSTCPNCDGHAHELRWQELEYLGRGKKGRKPWQENAEDATSQCILCSKKLGTSWRCDNVLLCICCRFAVRLTMFRWTKFTQECDEPGEEGKEE